MLPLPQLAKAKPDVSTICVYDKSELLIPKQEGLIAAAGYLRKPSVEGSGSDPIQALPYSDPEVIGPLLILWSNKKSSRIIQKSMRIATS